MITCSFMTTLAMVRGEACTYVYKGNAAVPDKLVVSFHCTPVPRTIVGHFTVRTMLIAPGQSELSEFQFAGSSEGHLVPEEFTFGARDHWVAELTGTLTWVALSMVRRFSQVGLRNY